MKIDNVILGGGIAGLAASYSAREEGVHAVIFEARDRAGGLLDNFTVDGFRFDNAVHLSFATEHEVREVFDRTAYHTHLPEAVNWDKTLWLRHPVQNNMYPLPVEDRVALVAGLSEAPRLDVQNYRDWLIHQYGAPIAERWPMIYTEKYWTLPAERLGVDWIGQRVRRADLREVLTGAFTEDTPNAFYTKEMRYPETGGYRHFIEPMIASADVHGGARAVKLDPAVRRIFFADGRHVDYVNLVSTLPLPRLLEMILDAPAEIRADSDSLFATQCDLISIGFNRPRVSPKLWFYIYDRDIWAARAYAPDWKSIENVPKGCSSLQFEIYSSRERPQAASVDDLKQNTIVGLKKMGLASEEDIIFVHHSHIGYANVVFDVGMEARRDRVRRWVEQQGVHVAGRFGEWAYLWSHQSMMSGLRAGRAAFASHASADAAVAR